ncbi:MAG: prepilin-type N-terminal cleavage/methylation domain-containing protein [Candidatus Gastranaerophilales bacterium]|nr:prepilin-type N-terminal cleavage/methylation domain-containing protein [Candidatus Gastranaerophilales bacterium]
MRKGFTLLELLIVVVIIGVLALIAAPSLLNAADQAKEGTVKANVSAAASSITSRFALKTSEAATTVASTIATQLNTDNKNPFDEANDAFSTTAVTEGTVNLTGDDTNGYITITGYGKDAASVITKKVYQAPSN